MKYSSRPNREPEWDPANLLHEIELLRRENALLSANRQKAYDYIRDKVNQLLTVIGTKTLKPEELDDDSLVEFDPIGIVSGAFKNILENLKETNCNLHFAHDEIQAIFDAVGSALLVLDPTKKIIAYNQKTKDLLVGHEEDVHGCNCAENICHGRANDTRCVFDMVMRAKREQQLQNWELNGRSFKVVGRPIYDDSSRITHVVISYADVTARKKAEESLELALAETQEANSKIQGILRSVSDGLLITDSLDRIVLLNPQAESLLGICLLDENAPSLDDLSSTSLSSLLREAKRGERFIKEDIVLCDETGADFIYEARVTVIRSTKGEYRGSITFLHDVTEQRALERSKSEFVSTAAHELRTPLATIIGYTDLLLQQEERPGECLHEYLNLIQNKAERLAEIVSDLLDISRIESGEALKLISRPHPLKDLCEDVVTGYQGLEGKHRIRLELPVNSELMVLVDRYAFTQVLENLISNAVKYSPDGGEIRLSATVQDGRCQIIIADQGIGMKPDQVEKVFDKFYRADATNTAVSGTGLGMTIVKHLVEAQQGTVQVDSEYKKGTRVRLTFPSVGSKEQLIDRQSTG